jgi:LPS-assembly protein
LALLALTAMPAALAAIALPVAAVAVEPPSPTEEIQFEADLVTYDTERNIIEATGRVVARQVGRTLFADVLIYDETENRIIARGNVKLLEPGGEIIEADQMELTGDMKEGVGENLRMIFADGARASGATGERRGGVTNTLNDAAYTACLPCPDDAEAPPLWQVRSVKVVHDQVERTITFDHAWLELGGVPVAYTPFLSRPDPTVRRKSGFLMPTFGSQSDLGILARIPYFVVIDDNQDATITPWITSQQYPVLQGEYRGLFQNAELQAEGSITQDTDGETGGHIFTRGLYDIDRNWRAGFDGERTLYRTYLRRYGFGGQRTLVSRLYGENFTERNYFVANAYAFQNLDENSKQETIPVVAPMLDYFYAGNQDRLGGFSNVRLNGTVLTRDDGSDTRRLSARGEWNLPLIGPYGNLFTVSAALYGDGYQVEDLQLNDGSDYSGTQGRLFPTAGLTWSLPLVSDAGWIQQTIEPTAQFVYAPRYGNQQRIPDEDSGDFELQTTNLFGLNPSPGLDRVLEGPRVNYGVQWRGYGANDANGGVFIGQTYQFVDDNPFGPNTGYHGGFSDIVSGVEIQPRRYLAVSYRNRFDASDLSLKTNEVSAWAGTEAVNVATGYVKLESQPSKNLVSREEIVGIANARISRHWRTQLTGVRDIKTSTNLTMGVNMIYEDECMLFSAGFTRRNIDDQGLNPQNIFLFRLWLKTLGDVSTGVKPTMGSGS